MSRWILLKFCAIVSDWCWVRNRTFLFCICSPFLVIHNRRISQEKNYVHLSFSVFQMFLSGGINWHFCYSRLFTVSGVRRENRVGSSHHISRVHRPSRRIRAFTLVRRARCILDSLFSGHHISYSNLPHRPGMTSSSTRRWSPSTSVRSAWCASGTVCRRRADTSSADPASSPGWGRSGCRSAGLCSRVAG